MPRKFYKKRRRRRQNKKKKWRQQKVSIGTIQKIAKTVATYQIKKKLEPKWSNLQLGFPQSAYNADPIKCLLFKSGLYKITQGPGIGGTLQSANMSRSQHHPQTVPTELSPVTTAILSGVNRREGETIEMTGLSVKGLFIQGSECPSVTVRISLCVASETLLQPVALLPQIDFMTIRRSIDDTEKLNVIKTWEINFNKTADTTERRRQFGFYHRFKKGRRIRYNENQALVFPGISEASYQDTRYYLVMYSDHPDEDPLGGIPTGIPNGQYETVMSRNLQFYGSFNCYYRDA